MKQQESMNGRGKSIGIAIFCTCLCLLIPVLLISPAAAADAMYRANPGHTGVFDNGGIEPGNTELWHFNSGIIRGTSPAVTNGVAYFGSSDDNLYAVDAATGKEKWRFARGDGGDSSPAVTNGVVYVGSYKNLHAVDAATGTEKWRFATGSSVDSSPAVTNGVVYVGSSDKNLYAVDAAAGTEKWRFTTGDRISSSPAVANGVVYVHSSDENLYAVDATTGREMWRFGTGGLGTGTTPTVADGVVYIGGYAEPGWALFALDTATGKEKWRFIADGIVKDSAAVTGGVVYIGDSENNLYAIDAATANQKWKFSIGKSDPMSTGFTSPSVANGVVYVGSNNHNLYAVDAANGKEKWRFTARSSIASAPVVANGVVYVYSDNNLYAIGGATIPSIQGIFSAVSDPTNRIANIPISIILLGLLLLLVGGYVIYRRRRATLVKNSDIPRKITAAEQGASSLVLFRTQAQAIIAQAKNQYNSGAYESARTTLSTAERVIANLKNQEDCIAEWRSKGHDTSSLEQLKIENIATINSAFQNFEQQLEYQGKLTALKEKGRQLLAESGKFGQIPDSLRSDVESKFQAREISVVEDAIAGLEKFRRMATPDLEIGLETTTFTAGVWVLTRASLKNTGAANATDVLLSFSEEFQTKGIKPVSVPVGTVTHIEFTLMPKNAGKVLLEAILTYKNVDGREYRKVQEFWIAVVEKGTTSSVDQFPNKTISSQDFQIIRAYEFYAGYIRLKISVKNLTPFTIHNVILEPDFDRAILYLERHEPEEYPYENEKIKLGTINPNNDRTVSLYLEPTICAKEGTDVQCHIRYKDAQGKPGSLDMDPLKIQVVCPIFETKEQVNIGSLKQLIESLPSRDTKIFSVPRNLDAPTQLKLFQSVIQHHDIRHISTLRRANNFESWYYGKTKVTQKDMVIKLGIAKDMDMVEITAFSHDPKDLTGLLAEINRHVTEEVSKRGNIQNIFNISIKDSVLTRTNLLNNCDMDGKCSGDVTIADSVVTGSNIG